ncbi:hypothetical protein Ancab_022580 [Ancistrocladus abbreviatus]
MNRLYLEKQIQDEAKMFWEMGKRLGAMYEGDETEVVEQLIALANRDRIADVGAGYGWHLICLAALLVLERWLVFGVVSVVHVLLLLVVASSDAGSDWL